MGKHTFEVGGMSCPSCNYVITNVLSGVDDVDSVSADYEKGIVQIAADEDVEKSDLAKAIESLGYTVKSNHQKQKQNQQN